MTRLCQQWFCEIDRYALLAEQWHPAKTVTKNWSDFGRIFEAVLGVTGKPRVEAWFEKLNRLRNLVAHPLRGDPSDEQRAYMLDCDQKVAALASRLDMLPES